MDIFDEKGIKPMLIAEQVEAYDDKYSIFELKVDGIRCIAYCDSNGADIRNKRDFKLLPRFPELETMNRNCRYKCILDGELNVLVNGKPDFYELQKRTLMSDPFKIKLSCSKYPANFVAYDIIYYKDKTITDMTLMERKQILQDTISENNLLSVSRYVETDGKLLFEFAKQQGLEGVVGKKKESLYWFNKRTRDWKKIKVMADYEAIAIAYIPKPNNVISLVLAKYNADNELVITNHVSLGVSMSKLKEAGVQTSKCPLPVIPKGYENAVWIKPVVCTVLYMPSEKEGLRQAVFKGIRADKSPEEIRPDK